MLVKIRSKRSLRPVALTLLLTMVFELVEPGVAFALTSGPSQPEMQSFTPVGTTDMVNSFTGDFNYNIPLLDVEGYPVNISYHSGISTEQEASWVGLGWNINPGNISHIVRGMPDDFNGETIEKTVEINEEVTKKFGMLLGAEFVGLDGNAALKVGANYNFGINVSNYSGVSGSFGMSLSGSYEPPGTSISAGASLGIKVSTDQGADIDPSLTLGAKQSMGAEGLSTAENGYFGKSYNSRQEVSTTSFGVNPSINATVEASGKEHTIKMRPDGLNISSVPVSYQNIVPVITNSSFMHSSFFQVKGGFENWGVYLNFGGSYGEDKITFDPSGSRRAYGYFNMQNAKKDDIVDFARDRDGHYNRSMSYLPAGNMTYDVYSVSGQGTSGSFRGFRNDIGSVYDPYTSSDVKTGSDQFEIGGLNLFEGGWDRTNSYTSSSSGPWAKYKKPFTSKKSNSLYEPHYFKQAGELSEQNNVTYNAMGGTNPLTASQVEAINNSPVQQIEQNHLDSNIRARRSNLLYYYTAAEASNKAVSLHPQMESFDTPGHFLYPTYIPRVNTDGRKSYHASEFTQVLPDGKRYIYGIPAMNISQQEYVVTTTNPPTPNNGLTYIGNTKPYAGSLAGVSDIGQKMYIKTKTPAYAHTYLLTEVLSEDYSDLTGDGISDDDLGSYTKFNYTLKDNNYLWRAPYTKQMANYDRGVASDCHDDKGTFLGGQKEIWMLHSIVTRNFVAEFYTSPRQDGLGSDDGILNGTTGTVKGKSYELDSIVLYNKIDRINNGAHAVPIKTVLFTYDYSLCKGTPNSEAHGQGKLTLRAISIRYGNSDIGYLSPYQFSYNSSNSIHNPDYAYATKDCWGNFKKKDDNGTLDFTNHEFPYVRQDADEANNNAQAWNLTEITLPSGGKIQVTYEADDYAYVQDRRAMEMVKVEGVGSSAAFDPGNSLFTDGSSPNLYIYFNRKKKPDNVTLDEWYASIWQSYLDNNNILQFNFETDMSAKGETLESCPTTQLTDLVKGYAKVTAVGDCGDGTHGYIKLQARTDIADLSLNPATLAAINYAKYYNQKALYPSSEMVHADAAELVGKIIASFPELSDFFRNPIKKYVADGRAKFIHLNRSFIRLCSQGFKKGGGQRVKRIQFTDNWNGITGVAGTAPSEDASYGSDYNYTTTDPATGRTISSGVASYEPIVGGDENPLKESIALDSIGKGSNFPKLTPIEVNVEGPIGEAMYPSPEVGYSKVTITSIHKNDGLSSQAVKIDEFYTAKDYPVRTMNTQLQKLEDSNTGTYDLTSHRQTTFRVAQGYTLIFNDMHGKPKQTTTYIAKGENATQSLAYKRYLYFQNDNGTLNNTVPCVKVPYINNGGKVGVPIVDNATLGMETDFTIDTREKLEHSETDGFNTNLNVFLVSGFPVPIPTIFPKFPKSNDNTFSAVINTKIIQQYGILKSVETFEKGAAVIVSNDAFDQNTGEALITRSNTEFKDALYTTKLPSSLGYNGMTPAYKDILYDEKISDDPSFNVAAAVVNDTFYMYTKTPARFRIGDELLLTITNSCIFGGNVNETYRLWVLNNGYNSNNGIVPKSYNCQCDSVPINGNAISYLANINCGGAPAHNSTLDYYVYTGANTTAINPSFTGPRIFNNSSDRVCNIREANLFDVILHQSDDKLISKILDQPNQIALKKMLKGGSTEHYPMDYFRAHWLHNTDYPALNAPYSVFPARFFYTASLLPCSPGPMYLAPESPPYIHQGVENPGIYEVFSRQDVDYNAVYGSYPKINVSNQVIAYDINVYSKTDIYLRPVDTTQDVFIGTLQDPDKPYNLASNNFYQGHYTFYFPYDAGNSLAAAQLTAINNPSLSPQVSTKTVFLHENVPALGLLKLSSGSYSYFPHPVCSGQADTGSVAKRTWYYTCSAKVIDRPTAYGNTNVLVALPHSRGFESATGSNKPFPKNDTIHTGTVEVLRSGDRNRLNEPLENVTSLTRPYSGLVGTTINFVNFSGTTAVGTDMFLNVGGTTYTDVALAPQGAFNPDGTYHNPFVTGLRGTYRPSSDYKINMPRLYNTITDRLRGYFTGIQTLWYKGAGSVQNVFDALMINDAQPPSTYYANTTVTGYNPWGMDVQVKDGHGNKVANIFGYENRLPTAIVANSDYNDAMYENFEDYDRPGDALAFYPNPMKQTVQGLLGGGNVYITQQDSMHTGMRALRVKTTQLTIPVPVAAADNLSNLTPFFFRPAEKYIVTYWQQVGQNDAVSSATSGAMSLTGTGLSVSTYLKTPVIDGWGMFEAEVTIPAGVTEVAINIAPGNIVDDVRILPYNANMKCYVYHPITRKLVATLDENHMSTFYEYSAEGKLIRIKKETEKGILTIKESRESVHNAIQGLPLDLISQ